MRERDIRIHVYLNKKEYKRLCKNVEETGLSREAYLRHLITGYVPLTPPPADYYAMMEQLYYVGLNLNQIAKKAHVLNVIDVQQYDEAVSKYNQIIKDLTDTVISPRRIE